MLGSSLSRSVLVLWCMIPVAIPLCAQQTVVWPALPGDKGAMNVSLIGTVQVEPPWDPEGDWFFSTTDFFIDGDYAYMGSRNGLLHIVDISDPTNMQQVARLAMPGPALDVKVANGLAVVSVQNGPVNEIGAVMVDVTDPTAPKMLSHVEDPFWSGVHNSFIYRGRAYLAHSASRGITVVDVTDPAQPFVASTWLNEMSGFGSIIHDIHIKDGLAFLSDFVRGSGGLVILDLADPDQPQTLSALSIAEGLHNCFPYGQYAYCNQELGGWMQSLHIIDVSDPTQPFEAATFTMPRRRVEDSIGPHNTWIEDDLLYWSFYDGGLYILDVSDPVFPVEVGYFGTPYAWGAQAHRGLIFVADARMSAIRALRYDQPAYVVRDMDAPVRQLSTATESTFLVRAEVESSRDVSAPPPDVTVRLLPDRAGSFPMRDDGTHGDDVAGDGRYAGIVRLPGGLLSGEYRIEVRAEDEEGRVYPRAGLPLDLLPSRDQDIIGDELIQGIVASGPVGVFGPEMVSTGPVFVGNEAAAIHIDGTARNEWELALQFADELDMLGYTGLRFAFHPGDATGSQLEINIGDYHMRLLTRRTRLVNLTDQEWQTVEFPFDVFQRERVIPTISFEGNLRGTFYLDDMRLVSERQVTAIEEDEAAATTPSETTLGSGYPNPFNSQSTIPLKLAQSGDVRLDVYNISGQRVRRLNSGHREAGSYLFAWDGRSELGREVATGVYLYRLTTPTTTQTRRILLLR
ncbi:MAG: T9SS type A sorting domain-containing protein [Gemmatimonadetes bacterium]|nr:T9SS type A sorting domain-containing protein [Gemmatimonadota bacterium]